MSGEPSKGDEKKKSRYVWLCRQGKTVLEKERGRGGRKHVPGGGGSAKRKKKERKRGPPEDLDLLGGQERKPGGSTYGCGGGSTTITGGRKGGGSVLVGVGLWVQKEWGGGCVDQDRSKKKGG